MDHVHYFLRSAGEAKSGQRLHEVAGSRRDAADHAGLRISSQSSGQQPSELGVAVRDVLVRSHPFAQIGDHRAQGEQRLVDEVTLLETLSAGPRFARSLRASEVH